MINKCHQYKKRVKSVKEGIFLLKKNNELRKGGYLKSFHKDIMKVVFFVCILFLLFFIIHTKLQKSIELQVLEVHDTYLILQDLKYSNDYRVHLVGKESTDFNVGGLGYSDIQWRCRGYSTCFFRWCHGN